jgi:hypothetical protein
LRGAPSFFATKAKHMTGFVFASAGWTCSPAG